MKRKPLGMFTTADTLTFGAWWTAGTDASTWADARYAWNGPRCAYGASKAQQR